MCGRLKGRGPVAQLVEQRTFNAWVAGSIPAGLTMILKDLRVIFKRQLSSSSYPSCLAHHLNHLALSLVFRGRERLGIEVQSGFTIGVPQQFLHDLHVSFVRLEKRCVGVS